MASPAVLINDFLGHRRLALVGVSRDPRHFTRAVLRELRLRHYDVVPVNPLGIEVDGVRCAERVQQIVPPVEGALLMTPPAVTEQVVQDCAEAGIRRVWMHKGMGGPGAVSERAVEFCHERGIDVVAGACPFMFLPSSGLFHRIHRLLLRFVGRAPA